MTSLRTRSVTVVTGLLLAAALSGCNDGEDPPAAIESTREPIPTYSTSTSPPVSTAPSGPVEPTLPAKAEAETRTGAEAFVEYYWAAVNFASKTGDVRLLESLDQASCSGCQGGVRFIKHVYARGGRVIGGDYQVVSVESARSPSGDWGITTHTRIGDQRVIGAGKLNAKYPGGRGKWFVALTRFRGSWSVTTLEKL